MPEFTDVEVYKQNLNATALHQTIQGVHVASRDILADTSPQGLGRTLKKNRFDAVRRHGKYLFVKLQRGAWLVMHFGMTGSLTYFGADRRVPDYTRLLVSYDNGRRLALSAPRKLSRVSLADSMREFIERHRLGRDAVALPREQFTALARSARGGVKSWLMNQHSLAGIGNVYSDEILFQARLRPDCKVRNLNDEALSGLYHAIQWVFDAAVKAHADPEKMPDRFLLTHRGPGGKCPMCRGMLTRVKISGRSGWYCPACQHCSNN